MYYDYQEVQKREKHYFFLYQFSVLGKRFQCLCNVFSNALIRTIQGFRLGRLVTLDASLLLLLLKKKKITR
jgi:hypothetical protein